VVRTGVRLPEQAHPVRVFLDVAARTDSQPLLIHDRTGYGPVMRYLALYLVALERRTPDQAVVEAERIAGRHLAHDLLPWLQRQEPVLRTWRRSRAPATAPSPGTIEDTDP